MAETCATTPTELTQTPGLLALKAFFQERKIASYVNETKGSFFIVSSETDKLSISFFTSGVLDLYGIRRDGALKFCDDGKNITMIGLGRSEVLKIEDTQLIIGNGGPRLTFQSGDMPPLLKKLHNYDKNE